MNKREPEAYKILRLNGRFLSLIAAGLIIVGLIGVGLYQRDLLGPIRSGEFAGTTVNWRISDHQSTGVGLTNSLSGSDQPEYSSESVVVPLDRDNNGSISNLIRFQGELEYYRP